MQKSSPHKISKAISSSSKFFCIFAGFFLALVALELFLRLLGFGYNLLHRTPVDIGADYRIYCVGESTTWGIGASDPISKGYPRQLENMLNEKYPEKKTQCFFDQTIGQNTSEILRKLPQHIRKYKPRLVILMVGANNWWNMDRSNILLFSKDSSVSESVLKVLIFLDQFRVWKLFKNMAFSSGFFKERWNYMFPEETTVKKLAQKMENEVDLNIFDRLAERDIEEMIKVGRSEGVQMIVCTYPIDSEERVSVRRGLAQKFQLPFVDLAEVFKNLENPKAYLSTEDYWHPNDRGYTVVAQNIYDCIVKNDFV
jgi:lysophospholipase L1-like esterase